MPKKIDDKILSWIPEDDIEPQAASQLRMVAGMPFIFHHIAVMPDCHMGIGATVGSCIPTSRAIMPATVGADIGCGMIAVQTSLSKEDVPANLTPVREAIEAAIPLSAGQYNLFLTETATQRVTELKDMANENGHLDFYNNRSGNWPLQIGSLGSGNHFIELVYDENDQVWAFLHSGSRGVGNKIAQHYINVAKKLMEKWFIELPDPDLAYLPQDTQEFRDYLTDLKWAQAFAKLNRAEMMDRVLDTIRETIGPFDIQNEIDCHHNFTQWENHMGNNVLISRKGAIQAREGQYGLIPGSMGTRSYVVRGKGNVPSFNTAPHGAGRRMARNVARRTLTMDDFDREMQGIEVRRSEAFLDELPSAYKEIDTVMKRSADLVEVVHELRQFVNVKGESPVHQPRAR